MLAFHAGDVGGFGITLVLVVSLMSSSATSGVVVYESITAVNCRGGFLWAVFKNF